MTHRLAVLISGSGTMRQDSVAAIDSVRLDAQRAVVGTNRADAGGVGRAQQASIATEVLDHRQYDSREAFDQAMITTLDRYQPGTVVLAGFMRILSALFVRHYAGQLINIHPSLLPKYRGLHTHARALEAGDQQHGCSIHFVTEELDGGPLIAQAPLDVLANDTVDSLSKRVQQREHLLYPLVLQWRAEQRLELNQNGVMLDAKPLPEQGFQLV